MVSSGKPRLANRLFTTCSHLLSIRCWLAFGPHRIPGGASRSDSLVAHGLVSSVGFLTILTLVGCFGRTANTYPPVLQGGGPADSARGNRILCWGQDEISPPSLANGTCQLGTWRRHGKAAPVSRSGVVLA